MSDETSAEAGTPKGDKNNGGGLPIPIAENDMADKLESLLDKLVPPAEVTVHTISGKPIVLPGAIPARRQVVVFRLMRDLTEIPMVSAALGNMSGAEEAGVAGIVDVVLQLATDIAVAEKLGAIFDAAYPGAIGEGEAIDHLPLEDLVAAIIPFSERFIKKVGSGMMGLANAAEAMPSN